MVQQIIERVRRAQRLDQIVLAIPSRDLDAFLPFSELVSLSAFPDEDDLVGRYCEAASDYDADIIVRIPCDNPCVQPEYIDDAVNQYLTGNYIFNTNTQEWTHGEHVDGLGCEVFSVSRLKLLDRLTQGTHSEEQGYREHPHRWFYEHLGIWKPDATIRLDVNTQADYDFIADIYNALYPTNPHFTITDILAYLDTKKVRA